MSTQASRTSDRGAQLGRRAANGHRVLEALFRQPYVTVTDVIRITGLSQPAANALTNSLAEAGVLHEVTGKQTYRVFAFSDYLSLFSEHLARE